MKHKIAALFVLPLASAALGQDSGQPLEVDVVGGTNAPAAIAVPAMPGDPGRQVAEVVASDLRSTGAFTPIGPNGLPGYAPEQAAAPAYGEWRSTGAANLVSGYLEPRPDGRITVGCYLHDIAAGRQLASEAVAVAPDDWRRAAHRCADMVYARLTGNQPFLDTKVVYVAETGPKNNRQKRIAIMDSDGSNHRYLTIGRSTVVTPRFSPRGDKLVYVSYIGRKPRVLLHDVASGSERLLIPGDHITFAPRFSPDGQSVVFSMAEGGNTDLYRVSTNLGPIQRLTSTPGADTSASFSPDGRRIVFESDRGGTQQLYVMNADGSGQRRITFGGGRYASPAWSPRGDLIAFTKIAGPFRIGVMNAGGGGEKILTDGWQDEQPSWAPNGQFVMFHRQSQGATGDARLYAVSINGGPARRLPTPVGGSDPSWSPLNN
ncbi:Tol-Pal system beta propeller repeat protein TolB [Sphingomonas jaspsi]|uniref:Tol-Pal system beta propeller repeat protein TolB n=1 Tax=Sphingomonas jaspsi TaxID=392409 RepID=UPI0004B107FA|nr:Tol-Pal system beta propeller repeat protein TolB [Sphingomonas jaspsi]